MKLTEFLTELGPVVGYYPRLSRITGGVKETVFLCQLLYWQGKQSDPGGWIYKSRQEITEETGLSRYEQEKARQTLKAKGFIEEKLSGLPRKLYFRLNLKKINNTWEDRQKESVSGNGENHNLISGPVSVPDDRSKSSGQNEPPSNKAENSPAIRRETSQQEGGKPANYIISNIDYLQRLHTETTKEKEKTKQKRKRKDFAANASLNNTTTTHLATPEKQIQYAYWILTEHGKYVLHRASEFCQRDDRYFQNTIKKYILTLGSGIVDIQYAYWIGDCRDARPRDKAKYLIYLLETEHKAQMEDSTVEKVGISPVPAALDPPGISSELPKGQSP